MLKLKVLDVGDVAETHLCCGCGVCSYLDPDGVEMVDDLDQGRRPRFREGSSNSKPESEARRGPPLRLCPGAGLEHTYDREAPGLIEDLADGWGPVLELWEGHAVDGDVRLGGSSGGAATALALACLEQRGMHGVLHTDAREDAPYLNRTVLSRSRAEMLSRTGSRYSPASPCDGLAQVEEAPAPCVFIGKPCDVAGAQMARRERPELDRKLGLTMAVFCAGTPSLRGTLELLERMGVPDPSRLISLRYRGNGWPGLATARFRAENGDEREAQLTYEQSWGDVLQKRRQWRCYVCPDHTGEFADISLGDPWYRDVGPDEQGRSLVVVRTELGREIVRAAVESRYLQLERVGPEKLRASQPMFERVRGLVWARVLVLRLFGAAAPRYRRLPIFRHWWGTKGIGRKIHSLLSTVRRVFRKRLRKRVRIESYEPPRPAEADSATCERHANSR